MAKARSFYFFDFDDNIMFLPTPIYILNTETGETMGVSTGEFANIQPLLGKPGKHESFSTFSVTIKGIRGSYHRFSDIPEDELQPGQRQYFVEDVEKAIDDAEKAGDRDKWKAPSWHAFHHACQEGWPISIVTARGHSRETLKAGVRVLVEKGKIDKEPNYHTIYPIGNEKVRRGELDDADLWRTTPDLKKCAIKESVDKALAKYGDKPEHCFGMSDDDPQNVRLIVRAMRECKKDHDNQRFFVIDTHAGAMVKLEVFPFDYHVTLDKNA